mmetsp:Transcript_9527/g.14350  ORF Transcript_9527/g.14350 Transcript_9527/m.14350 type:complete len:229 (+) Transcript_9527:69-755(+)
MEASTDKAQPNMIASAARRPKKRDFTTLAENCSTCSIKQNKRSNGKEENASEEKIQPHNPSGKSRMIREANESQCSGNSKAPPIFTDSCDVKMYENLSEKNLDIKEHTIEPKDFFSSPVLMHFKKVAEQRHIQLSNSCYEFNPYRFIKCLPPYEQVKSSCEQGNLLPEKQSDRKATLVLDLDETLVHCTIDPIPNPDYAFDVVCNQQTFSVYALKRPGLDDFLNARLF